MPTANNQRITLELEAGADPIRGSIEHPNGTRQSFWGWLELLEELRRSIGTDRSNPETPPSPPQGGDKP